MNNTLEVVAPVIALIGMFGMIVWIVRLTQSHKRTSKLVQIQADLRSRLLERFDSAQELTEYLQSEAGLRFLESVPAEKTSPYNRILGSLQAGIILSLCGGAFLFLRTAIAGAEEAFAFLGALALALGLGFLLSAGAAYILSKSWGLINGHGNQGGGRD
jgi:hypothetical protein